MKKSLLSLMLIGCLSMSFANDTEKSKSNMDDKKQEIISKINERISKLEKTKSCVSSAQNHEDMQKCRPKTWVIEIEVNNDRDKD